MSQPRKVAILCSGGDSAGMNPALKHFTEYARCNQIEPFGVMMGFAGLFEGKIKPMQYTDVAGIIHRGGTILGSSRFPEFHQPEVRQEIRQQLERHEIESLVVLGGNGSFKGMELLSKEHGIPVVGIPATIDNDVKGSENALGVDTALNVIRHCLDQIRDTAASFHRAFIVETMGRNCGYLAMVTALTSGAEICIVPEVGYDYESIEQRLHGQIDAGRSYLTAIVSEAIHDGSVQLKKMITERLGMSCRTTVLGHIQRGGSPTVADRLAAFESVTVAVDAMQSGQENFVVLYRNGQWAPIPVDEVEPVVISTPESLKTMTYRLAN